MITPIVSIRSAIHGQRALRSGALGAPGRLRTMASSEDGGGSMRGTANDSGESSRVSGGGGR